MAEKKLMVVVGAKATEFNRVMAAVKKDTRSISTAFRNVGKDLTYIGGGLTKAITAPVVGAAAAVGGLVTALGWGRLKAMDAAQAQLRGFGYSLKDVERISKQVNTAVTGTVMTMAEGTSVAAGALAAGVKEGAGLEAYIKRVGNAAVGANRDVGDMAMIFNRVQGGGKLMTRELNMIEQGMPGFSLAMAKHLGVPLTAFREMVTDGAVSAEQFMTVMDDFAGDMADAYAGTWEGMVANTKSNIGIIGQSLLGGVFEQSKESVGEFLELLRSDEAREWARKTGEKVAETFGKVLEAVKGVAEWWGGLSGGTKRVITTMAGILVVAGPVLLMAGKFAMALNHIIPIIGRVGVVIKGAGAALTFLTSPVGLIILAIAALITIGILLYKNWDKIKDFAFKTWGAISSFFSKTWDDIKGFFADTWESITDGVVGTWQGIKDFFTGIWDSIVEGVSSAVESFVGFFASLPERIGEFVARLPEILGKFFFEDLPYYMGRGIAAIVNFVVNSTLAIYRWGRDFIATAIEWISTLPGRVGEWLLETWNNIKTWAADTWETAKQAGRDFVEGVIDWVSKLPGRVYKWLTETIKRTKTWMVTQKNNAVTAGREFVESVINFIKTLPSRVWEWLVKTVNNIITWTGNVKTNAVKAGKKLLKSFIDEITSLPNKLWGVLLEAANKLLNIGGTLWNNAKRAAGNLWEGFKDGLDIRSPSLIERAIDDIAKRAKELPGELQGELNRLRHINLPSFQTAGASSLGLSHAVAHAQPISNRTHETREVHLLIDLKNVPAHMDQHTLTEVLRQAIRGGGIDRDLDEAGARSRRAVLAPQGGY